MSNKHPQSINDLPESLRRKIHHEASVESSKEQEVVMNQQNKTERWVEEFDKEIQKIREEIEEQRLELVEMNDCDGNVCECETGYDVAETYECKHCAWIVFNDSNLKNFISQLLSDARREEREKALNEAKELLTSDIYKEKYREILKEARAEAIRSCLEALPEKMIIDYYFSPGPDERAEYKKGFNQAISAAEERIKNLK